MSEVIDASGRFGELEQSIAKHPAGSGIKSERDLALEDLAVRSEVLEMAKKAYAEAIFRCKDLKIPNTVIARRTGRTEAAIRMFVNRKKRG